jgi:acyl-CoA reductase-like NAD-dependent aldehyde dehydrogenase
MLVEAFVEAGLPNGVINVIQTCREDSPAATNSLIAHKAIRKVEFIGSAKVGSIIAQECGKCLKPVLMEMGDKATAVVLKDANMEQAARTCIFGGKNTLISLNNDYASIYASWADLPRY